MWATSTRKPSTPRSDQNRSVREEVLRGPRGWPSSGRAARWRSGAGTTARRRRAPRRSRRTATPSRVGGFGPVGRRGRRGRRTARARPSPRPAASASWNQACRSEVWLGTMSTTTRMPRAVQRGDHLVEVGQRAEPRVDVAVVGDVVPAVGERGGVERAEPDRVDAERGEVRHPGGDAAQVADAVAVGVGEAARVDLVDDGLAPPRRVGVVGAGWVRRRRSRAALVELVGGRTRSARRAGGQPLTAPCVTPAMTQRCVKR